MIAAARFIENETGIEVSVETVFAWEPHPLVNIITYPSGRRYSLPDSEMSKHFTIVSPQQILVKGYGNVDERPTPKQREVP